MDLKEVQVQVALGTIPKELQWCKGPPEIARSQTTCRICGESIQEGSKVFNHLSKYGYSMGIYVCMDCSYVSFVKLLKMTSEKTVSSQ